MKKPPLSHLTEEQMEIALEATDAVRKRAEMFLRDIDNKTEIVEALSDAFEAIEKIISQRHEQPDSPAILAAFTDILKILNWLEGSVQTNSGNAVAYDAVFEFIKSGRVIALMEAETLTLHASAEALRDIAMMEAGIPRER